METREDNLRMVELEDMSNEFFHGIKPTYEFTYNGKRKRTGCARCAAMLDDSAVYGDYDRSCGSDSNE